MKSRVNEAKVYTKPTMRKALFEKIKAGSSGGNSGQWSAVSQRIQSQGRWVQDMKATQKSLADWGKQNWRTKSGKPSSETGERYLPEKAIKSLSAQEYAATTRAKREGTKAGKQFVKQPKSVAKKTARFR